MSSTTTTYGFPFPDESDPPDGATQVENLANAVDAQLAVTDANVATNAARATLLATLLGAGAAIHRTQASGNATTTGTTNATMTVSAVAVGHSFVAPASGIVELTWGASVSHSLASGSTIFIGCEVALGSTIGAGTVQSATVDVDSIQDDGTTDRGTSKARVVTGLTPGTTYNAYLKWRETGGGTATARNPWIISDPRLA